MFYDSYGNIQKVTDPNGAYIRYVYDSSGQYLTIQDLKNGGGNIVSLSLYIDNPNVVSGKVYFYGDITATLFLHIKIVELNP